LLLFGAESFVLQFAIQKNIKTKVCSTIILRVVLCGCETCSLSLKVKRRLSVFENRTLRRIFGPKKDDVTRHWENLMMSLIISVPH
jgi:hypothetical protein